MESRTSTTGAYPNGEYNTYCPTWYNGNSTTPSTKYQPTIYGTGYGCGEIVISGVSGRFPERQNVENHSRYLYGSNGQFGGEKKAQVMDPQIRVSLDITVKLNNLAVDEIQGATLDKLKSHQTYQTYQPYRYALKTRDAAPEQPRILMPQEVFVNLNAVPYTPSVFPVFVVHPIDGTVETLKDWAKDIKYPVIGIQFTQDALRFASIQELADYYLDQINAQFGQSTHYHLVGHTFGGCVAFEMALKQKQRLVSLSFLGGYPFTEVAMLNQKYKDVAQEALESEFLCKFVNQYIPLTDNQFSQTLTTSSNFEQRVETVINHLIKNGKLAVDEIDLSIAARCFVKRMFMLYRYKPSDMLRTIELLMIMPGDGYAVDSSALESGFDLTFKKWIRTRLNVIKVEGDQGTFLQANYANNVASIFNKYFSKFYNR